MPRQHLKRRKDGRYACRYKDKWFMGDTEAEVLEARETYKFQLKQGMSKDADHMTVREYAGKWLPVHKHHVGEKTYNDYAKQLNALIDVVGDMHLQDVKPTDVKAVWQQYDGYSASTIKRSRMLYVSLFDTAIEEGYCRINPCRSKHAQPAKGYAGSHRAITDDERELIHQTDHPFRLAAMVMLYAGLRRGEALALDIDHDVNFDSHVIHVRRAVRYDSNQPIVSDPKTEAGVRDVPMLSILEDELRGQHGLLVSSRRTGQMMSESAFQSLWSSYLTSVEAHINGGPKRWHHLKKHDREKNPLLHQQMDALIKSGHTDEAEELRLRDWKSFSIRPHDLRHSYCTMLRDSGVDMKLAMQWMGHADEKMILRIYDHLTDYRTQKAVADVESMLQSRQNGRQIKKDVAKAL